MSIKPRVVRPRTEEEFINGANPDSPAASKPAEVSSSGTEENKAPLEAKSKPQGSRALSISVTDHHLSLLDRSIAEGLMNGISGVKRSDIAKAAFLVWERMSQAERVKVLSELLAK
ncbi:hypothetical protein DBY68_016825 [Pseudocitrobacter sp. RIT415]|uniref:hypothetical protein n=1 Tax=Pseudocitrobacter sp. RIT415 TaxID=2202163 RepID=UPI000D3B43F7|nr:hypothetical protein [Pseudocitrobacter sp. RIT 415]RAU45279.1 hypothetical protein DBY68_016825 [Pseudocitrobacter sp. RIT 415]